MAGRIGLFGPFHSANLGDTATQMSVIANLKARNSGCDFVGICSDPLDAARTFRIPAIQMSGEDCRVYLPPAGPDEFVTELARRRSVVARLPGRLFGWARQLQRALNIHRLTRNVDALIVSGGGQLDDHWGGAWGRPFELLIWAGACRLQRKPVIVFATAVDNLRTALGKRFCFAAMRLANHVVFRDQYTVEVAARAGATGARACPDAAFAVQLPPSESALPADRRPLVLACPISARAWKAAPDSDYERYLANFTRACEDILEGGAAICLSNSQVKMDVPVARHVAEELWTKHPRERVQFVVANTVAEFLTLARKSDVVIASRLHGTILPLVVGTPVIAIAYMRKVSQVMADADLEEYCGDIAAVSAAWISAAAERALNDGPSLRQRVDGVRRTFRAELGIEFNAVLNCLYDSGVLSLDWATCPDEAIHDAR